MSATITHPATKYRVAIRDIAIRNAWTFTQVSDRTDRFEKKGTVVDVHHGPSNLIVKAEKVDGKSHVETGRGGKMFDVQAWLTGVADPERENYIRLSPEQVAKFESGQGIAKISTEVELHPAPIPAAKPAPKPRARKASTDTAPAKA